MSVEVEERTRALAFSDCPRPVGCAGSNQSKMPVFQLIPGYSSLCRGGGGYQMANFIQPCARTYAGQSFSLFPRRTHFVAARGISGRLVVSACPNRQSQIKNSSRPAIVAFCRLLPLIF